MLVQFHFTTLDESKSATIECDTESDHYKALYDSGYVYESQEGALNKGGTGQNLIDNEATLLKLQDWARLDDRDELIDREEWRKSNPEWAYHDKWVAARDKALDEGKDWDPDFY